MAVVRRLILHNCAMLNANEGINNAFFNLTFFIPTVVGRNVNVCSAYLQSFIYDEESLLSTLNKFMILHDRDSSVEGFSFPKNVGYFIAPKLM